MIKMLKTPVCSLWPFISSLNEQFEDNIATFELAVTFQQKILKTNLNLFEENKQMIQKMFK